MNNLNPLYSNDITKNRHNDNDVSYTVRESLGDNYITNLQSQIYELIKSTGLVCITIHQICEKLNLPIQTVSGRLSELQYLKNKIVPKATKIVQKAR